MKVLVTGATGFLGPQLCKRMVHEGYEVRILCRRSSNLEALAAFPFEKVLGDITDAESIRAAVRDCGYVIHAAANASHQPKSWQEQVRVNVEGTRSIARAARMQGVERFLHISSVAAIGIPTDPEQPADEDFPFNVENTSLTYHISKHRGEQEVLREVDSGLDAVIVNPALICGATARGYRVPQSMQSVLLNRIVPYSPGGQCLVHVEDVLKGVLLALRKGRKGNRYILGGSNIHFRDMSNAVCETLHLNRWLVPVPTQLAHCKTSIGNLFRRISGIDQIPGYNRRFCYQFYTSRKAREELAYKPRDFGSIVDEFASRMDDSEVPSRHAKCGL
jgi:dihydroflavonol-4-reductase